MPDSQNCARGPLGVPPWLWAVAVGLGFLDFWTTVLMGPGSDGSIMRSCFALLRGLF